MSLRRRYIRRADRSVVAVRLNLDTEGFTYRKWGGVQKCKAGDWIVDNGRDVYTVDSKSFARTYREVGSGTYVKVTPVWAEIAQEDGSVETKEGRTQYRAGDFIVSNEEDGSDSYAVTAGNFEIMYEPAESKGTDSVG